MPSGSPRPTRRRGTVVDMAGTLNDPLAARQIAVCRRFSAVFAPPEAGSKVGLALDGESLPLNALRHPPQGDTNGWYIWAGEELRSDDDFFKPLHVEHLAQRCPRILDYLGLPPGWRVLLGAGHEDVWFDRHLLLVE